MQGNENNTARFVVHAGGAASKASEMLASGGSSKLLVNSSQFEHTDDEGGDDMDAKEYFDILRDDAKRRDEYYREMDSRAEARAQALENRIMEDRRESDKRLYDTVNRIEDRITSEMSELRGEFRETKRWIIGIAVGILAIVGSAIFGIVSLINR